MRNQRFWICITLFVFYAVILFGILFMRPISYSPDMSFKEYAEHATNFVPFHMIRNYMIALKNNRIEPYLVFANIIGNIVIFIPLPMLLSGLTGRILRWIKLFGIGLLTLICLEIIQLLTRRGACDVDDVLLNMTGILLGYLIVRIYARKKYGIPVHNKEHVKPEMKQDLD
ncbi:MAG: VanZ family protein [Lachnospiraceae bacterium]|nr:VanZ family protein [Lachnospiraceae bacterium]MDY3301286.1 VanZ family protein [Lachnospiraceae bacterium]MEE3432987.1 VanZ family protein [Lachnospiraceae bacterium]